MIEELHALEILVQHNSETSRNKMLHYLDGKDIGRLALDEHGKIKRFPQPNSANIDEDVYFGPIEEKLKELNKLI